MELRQIRYFLKVAELLNFSEASKELFITQIYSSHARGVYFQFNRTLVATVVGSTKKTTQK